MAFSGQRMVNSENCPNLDLNSVGEGKRFPRHSRPSKAAESLPTTGGPARAAALTASHFNDTLPSSLLDRCCRFLQLLLRHDSIASGNLHFFVTWRVDTCGIVDKSFLTPAAAGKTNVFRFHHVLGFGHLLLIRDNLAHAIEFTATTSGTSMKQRTGATLRSGNQAQHYRQQKILHDRFRYSMSSGRDLSSSPEPADA